MPILQPMRKGARRGGFSERANPQSLVSPPGNQFCTPLAHPAAISKRALQAGEGCRILVDSFVLQEPNPLPTECGSMTIDKSLKIRQGGTGNRSVLTRGERLEKLKETERWKEGDSPLGLTKVRVHKLVLKKKKKKVEEDEDGASGAS